MPKTQKKKKKDANPVGRPTKYDPAYCQQLIDFLAKGYPFEAFAGSINVNVDTVHEWAKVHPEFSDAKKMGRSKGLRTMMDQGRAGMFRMGKDANGNPMPLKHFDAAIWIFMMKNMHKWTDKAQDDEQDIDGLDFIDD